MDETTPAWLAEVRAGSRQLARTHAGTDADLVALDDTDLDDITGGVSMGSVGSMRVGEEEYEGLNATSMQQTPRWARWATSAGEPGIPGLRPPAGT